MRFLKIFLITFSSFVGTVGVILGGMAVAGQFRKEIVHPQAIAFEQSIYEVTNDFEMVINTSTEEVTQTKVVLSFPSGQSEFENSLTDGVIIVPKSVTLGVPFTVRLFKEEFDFGTESLPWIKGGISTLKAKSESVIPTDITAKIYVDVPVYSLTVSTLALQDSEKQEEFNIGANFFARADFLPAASEFKFSKDGSDGLAKAFKKVYFTSPNTKIEMVNNSVSHNVAEFRALEAGENIEIIAQAFSSVADELDALEQTSGLSSELALDAILNFLNSNAYTVADAEKKITFEALVVGSFSSTSYGFETRFNQSTRVFAKNITTANFTHNLDIDITASNGTTKLFDQIRNVGLALGVLTVDGVEPATQDDFFVDSARSVKATVKGQEFTFYLPYTHSNIGQSFWDIITKKEGLNAVAMLVLFDDVSEIAPVINKHSLNLDGSFKVTLDVEGQERVNGGVYWKEPTTITQTLFIYDSSEPSEIMVDQFNLKQDSLGASRVFVPETNSYKTVVYFAFIEKDNQPQSEYNVSNYILTSQVPTTITVGATPLQVYEVLDGIIKPKINMELPEGYDIKVIFATVETNFNQSFRFDENGGYIVDEFSKDQHQNLQVLSFAIRKTLRNLDAYISSSFETGVIVKAGGITTLAVAQTTEDAFKVVFEVPSAQKEVFVRDWNANKIGVRFLIGGQTTNIFTFTRPIFDLNQEFEISVHVDKFTYAATGETGFRNFEIEISYAKGSQSTSYIPVREVRFAENDFSEAIENEVIFEVYDGKIAQLKFGGTGIENSSSESLPFIVRTNLKEDQVIIDHISPGVKYAATDSINTIGNTALINAKPALYNAGTTTVNIVAFDKYGREIEYADELWRLVSSDQSGKFLTISPNGQSINFISSTNEPVYVSIVSSAGVGGKSIVSEKGLYFSIETPGKIASVATNATGAGNGFNSEFSLDFNHTGSGVFSISDYNTNNFENKVINVLVDGLKGKGVNLARVGKEAGVNIINILQLLYALPNDAGTGYEIFDLVQITKFYPTLDENFERFASYITFDQDANGAIQGFTLDKDFGQKAFINFRVETAIGLNFELQIEINPSISATLNQYGHQNEGANGQQQETYYYGAFAEYLLEVVISDFNTGLGELELESAINGNLFTPIVYDFETKKVIATKGAGRNNIMVSGSTVTISLYLEDVHTYTLRTLVFVLDGRASVNAESLYVRNLLDFSQDINVRVNPNLSSLANSENTFVEASGNEFILKIDSNRISSFLGIGEVSSDEKVNVVKVWRKVSSASTKELSLSGQNNVLAEVTDSNGQPTNSQYVAIVNNILEIRQTFINEYNFYITIYQNIASANARYKVATYKVTLVPSIVPNAENSEEFVRYDGKDYLQLISDSEVTFYDLASKFDSYGNSGVVLRASFDAAYRASAYWTITDNQSIIIKPTNRIVKDLLNVTIEIENVAKIHYAIILMPIKAPLVKYSELYAGDELVQGGGLLAETNIAANSDLARLLSPAYLLENDVHDYVMDASSIDLKNRLNASGQDDEGNDLFEEYGFISNASGAFYEIIDDAIDPGMSARVANINHTTGVLTTKVVGKDTYIMVVAIYNNEFKIYYRLKIISSAELMVFYPYADNTSQESRAEYIFFGQSATKSINFASNAYGEQNPATAQKIENAAKLKEDGTGYDHVDRYVSKRFEMYRGIKQGATIYNLPLTFNISSIRIKSIITSGGTTVASANYAQYVTADLSNPLNMIFYKGAYTVVFEVETDLFAKIDYVVVAAENVKNLQVVEKTGGQSIGNMPAVPNNYTINIWSTEDVDDVAISNELLNKYLKEVSGTTSNDRTGLLKFHIIGDYDKLLSINQSKVIEAKYSVNTINAQIMFYTIYGPVATYNLNLISLIQVVNPENSTENRYSQTVYAGQVYDFADQLGFAQIDETGTIIGLLMDASDWTIEFVGAMPNYIERVQGSETKFVILPITDPQSLVSNLTISVKVGEGNEPYKFNFVLTVASALEAVAKANIPTLQVKQTLFAGEDMSVSVFGDIFTNKNTTQTLVLSQPGLNDLISVEIPDSNYSYEINVMAVTGAFAVGELSVDNNLVRMETKPVSSLTKVVLRVVINFSVGQGSGYYSFMTEGFYAFEVRPDSELSVNYPIVNGEQFAFESVYQKQEAGINLSQSASFQTEPRVKVTPLDGKNKEVYIKYSIVDGERNLTIEGGVLIKESSDMYDFEASSFNFTFPASPNYNFATIDFAVYVSGISRIVYTLKVYKEISSVFKVQINQLNATEGTNSEIFYLGEDRRDIFNGAQAFKFVVSNVVSATTTIGVHRRDGANTSEELFNFTIFAYDKGVSKTIKFPVLQGNKAVQAAALTAQNVRFRIGGSSTDLTLADLASGQNEMFARNSLGDTSFQVVRRLVVTYLDREITDTDFLQKILVGESNKSMSDFKVKYDFTSEDAFEINEVKIFIRDNTDQNSLGTYYYSVKPNFVVENSDDIFEITVGETRERLLEAFGIKKATGEKFVTYAMDNSHTINSALESGIISLNMLIKTKQVNGLDVTDMRYADTGEPYSHTASTAVAVIQPKGLDPLLYDFNIMAMGAPNQSVLITLVFKYLYQNVNKLEGEEETIEFIKEITVKINPNWDIKLYNLDGSLNSASSPERITKEMFGSENNIYKYVFADTRNSSLDRVFAYKLNLITSNLAVSTQLKYEVEVSAYGQMGGDSVSGTLVSRYIGINKPEFAERQFNVKIYDDYGYSVYFHFVVEPEEVISYDSMTSTLDSRVYEGDSLGLYSTAYTQSDVDHFILLNDQALDIDSIEIRYTLLSDNGTVLDVMSSEFGNEGFVRLDTVLRFKYLKGSVFSQTQFNAFVYIQIELKMILENGNYEIYTINSSRFYLYQRYTPTTGETKIMDGREISLINHIQIADKKEAQPIGQPKLYDDKTLYIKDAFTGEIRVAASNGSVVRTKTKENITNDGNGSFVSLRELFGNDIDSVLNFNFYVTKIVDNSNKITITIENNNISLTNNASGGATVEYIVHLYGGNGGVQYLDKKLESGAGSISLGSLYGIIGYELVGSSPVMFDIKAHPTTTPSVQALSIGSVGNFNAKLTLTNIGALTKGIKTIVLKQITLNTFNIEYGNNKIEGLETITHDGKTYLELDSAGLHFSGANANWIITGYETNQELVKLQVVRDKLLAIVTVNSGQANDFVDVKFNGINNYSRIYLNQNGTQRVSVLDLALNNWGVAFANFNQANYALAVQPIEESQLAKIKGLIYYNDTIAMQVGFNVNAGVGGVKMGVSLVRTRNEQTTHKYLEIPVYSYTYTYNIGVSLAFNESENNLIQAGDTYHFEILSIPSYKPSFIKVAWPNTIAGNEITETTDYLNADFGSYTVSNDMKDILVQINGVNGKTVINLDSKEQFVNLSSNKLVNVNKFYIIEFNGALHILDPINFEVSPHYYGIDTSAVYEGQARVITDYAQKEEVSGQIPYVISLSTWAGNISFVDPYGRVVDYNGETSLDRIFSLSTFNDSFRFTLEDGGGGAGEFDIYGNLTVKIPKGAVSDTYYWTIKIQAALNGKHLESEGGVTKWLDIGEVNIVFSTLTQYQLYPGVGYVISANKIESGNEEVYLKYIEIASEDPVTFSTTKLFENETLDYANILTVESQPSTALGKVFLTSQQEADYLVNLVVNGIGINTVLQSEFIETYLGAALPTVIGTNILKNETVSLQLTIGGVTHTASYTNHENRSYFKKIPLSALTSSVNGQTFDTLIRGAGSNFEIIPTTASQTKVKIAWTEINLKEIASQLKTTFFGDGITTSGDNTIISILKASTMFKLTKIDPSEVQDPSKIESVFVNIAAGSTEYFATTQIVLNNTTKELENAQTIVHKLENTNQNAQTMEIELYELFDGVDFNGGFTSIVLVQKLKNLNSIQGPVLLNLKGVYSFEVGKLEYNTQEHNLDLPVTVYKHFDESRIDERNISGSYLIGNDLFKLASSFEEGGIVTYEHSIILTKRLTENLPTTGVPVTFAVNLPNDAEKVTNLISTSTVREEDEEGVTTFRTIRTYEYIARSISSLTLNYDEVKTLLRKTATSANEGTLLWHEVVGNMPLGKVYYNHTLSGQTATEVSNDGVVSGLVNGVIVTNVWNGTLYYEDIDNEDRYLQITYDRNGNDEEVVYFEKEAYRIPNTNYIKVGDLFANGFALDQTKFGVDAIEPIKTLQSIYGSSGYGIKSVGFNGKTYALIHYKEANRYDYNIFDLIFELDEDGQNTIKKIAKSEIVSTTKTTGVGGSLGWEVVSSGYYTFKQGDKHFGYANLNFSSAYNLFEIFETDLILEIDGEIEIQKIISQIELFSVDSNPDVSTITVTLQSSENHKKTFENISISKLGDIWSAVLNDAFFDTLGEKALLNFYESLTSNTISYYQSDASGNEITIGAIFEKVNGFSLVDTSVAVIIIDISNY